jgi:1,4-alpha-glucan branching enzyme
MPVIFTFRHPGVRSVTVAGDFNDWNTASHPMVYDVARDAWTLTIDLAPGRYEYKFYVDGAQWWNDVHAPKVPNIWGSENSYVEVG